MSDAFHSENEVRETVNWLVKIYGEALVMHNGDPYKALVYVAALIKINLQHLEPDDIAFLIAFATRRIFNKRSDLVKFSVN